MSHCEQMQILLIEDNPDDEELTLMALRENNIANDIHVIRDGAAAMDYFFSDGAEDNPMPRLILLDLKLPKVNGLEILARLKTDPEKCRIPVTVLTSSREEPDIETAYRLGVNSYIVKPVNFEQFIAAIKQLGLYWLVLNESLSTRPSEQA